jgi:hypothetical protein
MASLTIPGIAGGKACVLRFDRIFDGLCQSTAGSQYVCGETGTSRVPTSVTWRVTASTPCDETKSILSLNGLVGSGSTIARKDGFAHFLGRCRLVEQKQNQPEITRFRCIFELIGRAGSHQALGEQCDQREHIEGWLIGQGLGALRKYTLRAVIVGKGTLPDTVLADASVNRLTGTLVKNP